MEDQLRRIGKVELPPTRPILGSVKTREYRNKLDFACANKRYLTKEQIRALPPSNEWTSQKDWPSIGFHISGAFDKVLPITRCWLMDPLNNQIRNALRDTANIMGMDYFDLRAQTGLLRDVIIRNSASGEWMVIVQFHFSHPLAEGEQLAMQPGDPVTFTDVNGRVYRYVVSHGELLQVGQVSEARNNGHALGLYTCAYDGTLRFIVLCDRA